MIVQTMQRQYAVLQVLHSDAREESSLCKDLETDQLCLLVRFRDAADCRRMLPLMAAQRSNRFFAFQVAIPLYQRISYPYFVTTKIIIIIWRSLIFSRNEIG